VIANPESTEPESVKELVAKVIALIVPKVIVWLSCKVAGLESVENGLFPAELVARTLNVYACLYDNPVIVHVEAEAIAVQLNTVGEPARYALAVYPVIDDPPLLASGTCVQEIAALARLLFADAVTPVGDAGTPIVVTVVVPADELVPTPLVATTEML